MTPYEQLEQLAHSHNIPIDLSILREDDALDGHYIAMRDGSGIILINRHRTLEQRTAALAEELGHHFRSVGDLRSLATVTQRKQEQNGRSWSFQALLPPEALAALARSEQLSIWDIAEDQNLPATFVSEALDYYRRKLPTRQPMPQVLLDAMAAAAPASISAQPPAPVVPTQPIDTESTLHVTSTQSIDTETDLPLAPGGPTPASTSVTGTQPIDTEPILPVTSTQSIDTESTPQTPPQPVPTLKRRPQPPQKKPRRKPTPPPDPIQALLAQLPRLRIRYPDPPLGRRGVPGQPPRPQPI